MNVPRRRVLALVAEDYPDGLELLVETLEAAGLEVVGVPDGVSALAEVRERLPGVIVLDLHMPGMDGYAVTTQLRSESATVGIPIVILTADATEVARARALVAGADLVLTKPILPSDLVEAIGKHVPVQALVTRGG